MKPLTTAPKGTRDVAPAESYRWQFAERSALAIAEQFGFFEMRTPTFEHTELFSRAVGDTTDVVSKEMYTFTDKGDRSVTLRPEGTAGVLRAAIEDNLLNGQLPLKASYVISCFRYEKPQAGRLREFHQFGIESLGSDSPAADAESIAVGSRLLDYLGVSKVKLYINSIGCRNCRPDYQKKLKEYFASHEGALCETCRDRLVTNPLRIIDCKVDRCKELARHAPKMIDHLCDECSDHFTELKERLDAMGIAYELDPDIVRGLDYYTKTVFEFVTEEIGAQGTVCGGGRYDGLIEQLGGPPLSGVGFAMGIERLLMVMDASGASFPPPPQCALFVAPMGKNASIRAGAIVHQLRIHGVYADSDCMGRSLKAQMRYANNIGAQFTMVLGDEELAMGSANLKDMQSGETTALPLDDNFAERFSDLLIAKQLAATTDAAEGK